MNRSGTVAEEQTGEIRRRWRPGEGVAVRREAERTAETGRPAPGRSAVGPAEGRSGGDVGVGGAGLRWTAGWTAASGRGQSASLEQSVAPQGVVGEGDQQRHTANGPQAAHPEAREGAEAGQGVDTFGGCGALLVDGLGVV